jgi:dTDP-4-amino-4,6-dideoxygalactose transaminase
MKYDLLREVSEMTEFDDPILTSRAASAIYLSLMAFPKKGKIILPSTICLSPIMASKLAGFEIIFVGVDQFQMDIEAAAELIASDSTITAILIPELYGYPVNGMDTFWKTVEHREILVIEDLAQTWGKSRLLEFKGNPTIVTIYSFGQTKFFSEIRCGAVTPHDSSFAREIREVNTRIKFDQPDKYKKAQQMYESAYADKLSMPFSQDSWQVFFDQAMSIDPVLYNPKLEIDSLEMTQPLNSRNRVQDRNAKHLELLDALGSISNLVRPEFYNLDYPVWRTTLRVDPKFRDEIVSRIRLINLPVSTWYLAMHKYVPSNREGVVSADLTTAESFSKEVINLFIEESTPLGYSKSVRDIFFEVMN